MPYSQYVILSQNRYDYKHNSQANFSGDKKLTSNFFFHLDSVLLTAN